MSLGYSIHSIGIGGTHTTTTEFIHWGSMYILGNNLHVGTDDHEKCVDASFASFDADDDDATNHCCCSSSSSEPLISWHHSDTPSVRTYLHGTIKNNRNKTNQKRFGSQQLSQHNTTQHTFYSLKCSAELLSFSRGREATVWTSLSNRVRGEREFPLLLIPFCLGPVQYEWMECLCLEPNVSTVSYHTFLLLPERQFPPSISETIVVWGMGMLYYVW